MKKTCLIFVVGSVAFVYGSAKADVTQTKAVATDGLYLIDDATGGTVGLAAPSPLTSDYVLTFPDGDGGTNQVLKTDGAGNLDWMTVAGIVTSAQGQLIRRGATADEAFDAKTDNRVVRGDGTNVVSGQIDDTAFFTSGAQASSTAAGIVSREAQASLTLNNDFSAGVVTFYRVGSVVTATMTTAPTFSLQSAPTSTSTIASGFRPSVDVKVVSVSEPSYVCQLSVKSTGVVQLEFRDWTGTAINKTSGCAGATISYMIP